MINNAKCRITAPLGTIRTPDDYFAMTPILYVGFEMIFALEKMKSISNFFRKQMNEVERLREIMTTTTSHKCAIDKDMRCACE